MSDLALEVGKTYLRNCATVRKYQLGSFDLVKILGVVDEHTREYQLGYRFFGDDGQFFTEDGKKIYHSLADRFEDNTGWRKPTWNDKKDRSRGVLGDYGLLREAVASDFTGRFTEKLWIPPSERLMIDKYIPTDSSGFMMKLGGVYVDRMGFAHLITEIVHSDKDHVQFSSSKSRGSFLPTGKYLNDISSMGDLAFQKI